MAWRGSVAAALRRRGPEPAHCLPRSIVDNSNCFPTAPGGYCSTHARQHCNARSTLASVRNTLAASSPTSTKYSWLNAAHCTAEQREQSFAAAVTPLLHRYCLSLAVRRTHSTTVVSCAYAINAAIKSMHVPTPPPNAEAMTPAERLAYLRSRGVEVDVSETRRRSPRCRRRPSRRAPRSHPGADARRRRRGRIDHQTNAWPT